MPDDGRRLVEAAADAGLLIRLIGGVAIWLRASAEARRALGRDYPDLDLVAHEKESRQLRAFLEENGYEGDRGFNARHGAQRLLFRHRQRGYQIDIFLDVFNMSHKLDLGRRLRLAPVTLPAADLLLTKLQIAELNQKDAGDAPHRGGWYAPAEPSARNPVPRPAQQAKQRGAGRPYCRPSRASRTSVTASGNTIAITARSCSAC